MNISDVHGFLGGMLIGVAAVIFYGFNGRIMGVSGITSRLLAKPMLCDNFNNPTSQKIDAPLILGAVVFGLGWGWAGFCPGPAIVGIGLGLSKAIVFVCAMLVGMFLAKKILK